LLPNCINADFALDPIAKGKDPGFRLLADLGKPSDSIESLSQAILRIAFGYMQYSDNIGCFWNVVFPDVDYKAPGRPNNLVKVARDSLNDDMRLRYINHLVKPADDDIREAYSGYLLDLLSLRDQSPKGKALKDRVEGTPTSRSVFDKTDPKYVRSERPTAFNEKVEALSSKKGRQTDALERASKLFFKKVKKTTGPRLNMGLASTALTPDGEAVLKMVAKSNYLDDGDATLRRLNDYLTGFEVPVMASLGARILRDKFSEVERLELADSESEQSSEESGDDQDD